MKLQDSPVGTHAAPWYVTHAIKSSKYFTEDGEAADIVYVFDYCYYTWWLAHVHTKGREAAEHEPGDVLVKLYEALMRTPRWQRKQVC